MRISDWSSDVCSSDLASSDPTGGNATVTNDAVADLDGLLAAAGNDVIVAGNGNDTLSGGALAAGAGARAKAWNAAHAERSEEHTSELQSLMRISYAVFCLKKKNKPTT